MPNLKTLELDMFAFFEMTPDLVCIAGKDGFFRKVNPAVVDKLGYSEEELFARPISSFIHPEDEELTRLERSQLLKGKALINFQNRYVSKAGKIIWLEWTSIYFAEKEIVFAIAKDITERKQLEIDVEEKYKKFKSLATHFKSSLEEERKYLAIELHEELAQLASVVKMDLDWVNNNAPDLPEQYKARIDHALVISDLLINTIRRVSFSISPNMLGDLGLNATLRWHCNEFSLLNGIPCRFESNYDETGLSDEIKLDFFRICQESLTNVMYHAEATKVNISIEDTEDRITMKITDDGKGFDSSQQKQSTGLINMQERAASINGKLTIKSQSGQGTTISVSIRK